MTKTLIKALRTPIAKFITRGVGYVLAFLYAKAGIDAAEAGEDTGAIADSLVAVVIGGMTLLADYLHHRADKSETPDKN